MISVAQLKAAVTPVRQQWSYCSVVLSHRIKLSDVGASRLISETNLVDH